ncbi:hypothetical protein ACFL47_04910 [Candidatus Latescibacterota bacterium]
MNRTLFFAAMCACIIPYVTAGSETTKKHPWSDRAQTVIDTTEPLKHPRGNRLPLFTNPTSDPGVLSDRDAETLVGELDKRGIAVISSWRPGDHEGSLAQALPIARAQKKLGLLISTNATSCTYSFFNGDERTAHIDDVGKPFFDTTLWRKEMGCPFSIDYRKPILREQVEYYAREYERRGLDIGFVWADWEIDGPLEVNGAHETSKRCARCREHIPALDSFNVFQKSMREMRSYLQYYAYTEPILSRFPEVLLSNYAVYPHDGYRYWLDYFEDDEYVDGQPFIAEQGAKYRTWYDDYPLTGYTYAMPVVYTWYRIFNWYDFDNSDYRWFYNMLLVASNAGKSTPLSVPIISFIRWHTTAAPETPDPSVKQMSGESYKELLWHMMLRGVDTFFVWCNGEEAAEEVGLAHEVYAAAQEYGNFLEHGIPISFEVPDRPGTVISGLVLRDHVLIRRTDFGGSHEPLEIMVGTKMIRVSYAPGECTIINLQSD